MEIILSVSTDLEKCTNFLRLLAKYLAFSCYFKENSCTGGVLYGNLDIFLEIT